LAGFVAGYIENPNYGYGACNDQRLGSI